MLLLASICSPANMAGAAPLSSDPPDVIAVTPVRWTTWIDNNTGVLWVPLANAGDVACLQSARNRERSRSRDPPPTCFAGSASSSGLVSSSGQMLPQAARPPALVQLTRASPPLARPPGPPPLPPPAPPRRPLPPPGPRSMPRTPTGRRTPTPERLRRSRQVPEHRVIWPEQLDEMLELLRKSAATEENIERRFRDLTGMMETIKAWFIDLKQWRDEDVQRLRNHDQDLRWQIHSTLGIRHVHICERLSVFSLMGRRFRTAGRYCMF